MPSISKSQRDNLGFLDSQAKGLQGASTGEIKLNNVEAILYDFAVEFQKKAIENLNKSKAVASGHLASSIRHELKYASGTYTLQVFLADYYDYVNKGVKGVKSSNKAPNSPYQFRTLSVSYKMANSLQAWANSHNLKARVQNKSFPHRKTATFTGSHPGYSLAVGIKKYGIKQTQFFDNALAATYPGLAQKLAKALGVDLRLVIRQGIQS